MNWATIWRIVEVVMFVAGTAIAVYDVSKSRQAHEEKPNEEKSDTFYEDALRRMEERINELEKRDKKVEDGAGVRRRRKRSSSVADEDGSPVPKRNTPGGRDCSLCNSSTARISLMCGHFALCASCSSALNHCPVCRAPVPSSAVA